jgi:hypothetical protein
LKSDWLLNAWIAPFGLMIQSDTTQANFSSLLRVKRYAFRGSAFLFLRNVSKKGFRGALAS